MKFEKFISRVDEILIAKILGRDTIKTLEILNSDNTRISILQKVLLDIYAPQELLEDKTLRNELIDLLKTSEAIELLLKLNDASAEINIYDKLKNKFKSKSELKVLFEYFELEFIETETKEGLISLEKNKPQYPLFKHQREAIKELKNKINRNGNKVLLHMPTGSGKTRTAMDFICQHLRNNEPTTVIWLAHTEELCEQAYQEFNLAWNSLGNREIEAIRYWGNSQIDLKIIKDGFIVCGLSKLYSLLTQDSSTISIIAQKCSLVIMDEAHMAIAPTFKLNLNTLISFGASLIGLSATPGRTYNDPYRDIELANFFNKQKVTLKVEGFNNPVDYLIDQGYLAKIKNKNLLYESGIKLSNNDIEYLNNNFVLPDHFLKKLSNDQKRNILIIQKIEELFKTHKRIIVFALSVEHSNLIATCLKARGVNAFSLTGQTGSVRRKELINKFKSTDAESMILCNYGILTTGFDAPNTSCAVITRPTDSLVLYSQMVGRAIRGINAGGNIEAEIVTVIDTQLPGFDKISNAFFNWEDVWN
jgi:DNA repair protein RadD